MLGTTWRRQPHCMPQHPSQLGRGRGSGRGREAGSAIVRNRSHTWLQRAAMPAAAKPAPLPPEHAGSPTYLVVLLAVARGGVHQARARLSCDVVAPNHNRADTVKQGVPVAAPLQLRAPAGATARQRCAGKKLKATGQQLCTVEQPGSRIHRCPSCCPYADQPTSQPAWQASNQACHTCMHAGRQTSMRASGSRQVGRSSLDCAQRAQRDAKLLCQGGRQVSRHNQPPRLPALRQVPLHSGEPAAG